MEHLVTIDTEINITDLILSYLLIKSCFISLLVQRYKSRRYMLRDSKSLPLYVQIGRLQSAQPTYLVKRNSRETTAAYSVTYLVNILKMHGAKKDIPASKYDRSTRLSGKWVIILTVLP